MWRNNSSNSALPKILSLVGGIGLGAGLLYLLDPQTGRKRRERLIHGAADLGHGALDRAGAWAHTAKDYAGDTAGSLLNTISGSVTKLLGHGSEYAEQAKGYAADKAEQARQYALHQLGGHEEHRISTTVCALGSMALGAALMYAFDPTSGRNRRKMAADLATEAGHKASDAVSTGYKAVSGAVSTGYDKVSGAVSNVARKVGISQGHNGGTSNPDSAESTASPSRTAGV